MAEVDLFRGLCPSEVQEFNARARADSEGLSYEDLAKHATHDTYHPVYRREIARQLFLRLDDLCSLYVMSAAEGQ